MSMAGKTIAHYTITEEIGRGGMGEVYLATDTKLKRQVAIKVLSAGLAGDEQHMARLTREAEVLASLDHPGIGQIYGIEDVEGGKALVLQLIEGPTLADRIKQGPIPIEEALRISLEIAEALEAAHAKGIIHRDLKPANIKITPGGKVKILDFGLAKAVVEREKSPEEVSDSPTLMIPPTQTGVILGTPAYMSPQQACGQPVDKQTDVWAFGSVMYEMLTGQPAFRGRSPTDLLAVVLRDDPDWRELPSGLPRALTRLVRRCLAKSPTQRLRDIGDARLEIEEFESLPNDRVSGESLPQPWYFRRSGHVVLLAGIVFGAVGGLFLAGWFGSEPHSLVRKLEILTLDPQPLATGGGKMLAISPDGRQLAYVDRSQLFVRNFTDSDGAVSVPNSELGISPFFSPDGEWLAFHASGMLHKVWLTGNERFQLCAVGLSQGSGTWSEGDQIVFSDGRTLWTVFADLPVCRTLGEEQREPTQRYQAPQFLPGGKQLLIQLVEASGQGDDQERASVAVVSANSGELRKIVVEDARDPHYLKSGHLIFRRGRTVFGQPFDPERLATRGDPAPLLDEVAFSGLSQLDVSADGTLVYAPAGKAALDLVWVDPDGSEKPLGTEPGGYWAPRISPSGNRLAVSIPSSAGRNDLALIDLRKGTQELFAEDAYWPAWSPDGSRIAFVSDRELPVAIWWQEVRGGVPRRLETGRPSNPRYVLSYSSDPPVLTFYETNPKTKRDILVMTPGNAPVVVVANPGEDKAPRLSSNAELLAYVSDKSGRDEVYVMTCLACRPDLDLAEEEIRVSLNGGTEPVWSQDERQIFFRSGSKMMASWIRSDPALDASVPELVFVTDSQPDQFGNPNYSVSPDGRFLMIKASGDIETRYRIKIILNWFEELKRLVPIDQ